VNRPIVGILCGRSPIERYSVHQGYVASVAAVGGLPVIMPAGPDVDPEVLADMVGHCAAIIATGGGDVSPECYTDQTDAPDLLMDVDPGRDANEIAVVRRAIETGRRVLGVCRGIQLLAAIHGGTLVHDLVSAGFKGHWDEERQYEPVHAIHSQPGSAAAAVLGAVTMVNSIHHQAVADPGPTLVATAWSDDGVIEAIEAPGLLGVQWHPERLSGTDARHLAPFAWALGH